MNDYFYIDASGQQKGPIPPSQFSMFNVSADTLVWCKGMADWQRAGAVDELRVYLDNDANGTTPPPTPGTAGTAGTASGAPYDNVYHSMGSGTPNQSMPCPPSNLVWAIVSTILCCLPTGIVAIVYACKVDNLYLMGNYQGAVEASNKARNWAIGGLIASVVFYFVYILVLFSVGFGSIARFGLSDPQPFDISITYVLFALVWI